MLGFSIKAARSCSKAAALTAALVLATASCGEKAALPPAAESASPAVTDVRVSGAGVDAAEPAVAAGENGTIFVAYVEHNPDKSADLYVTPFAAGHERAGERVRVNPTAGEVKAWYGDPPTIAVSGSNLFVGWTRRVQSDGGAETDVVLSVSRDGGQTFAEPVKVNDDNAPASHGMHSLAVAGDAVYMSWLDERNVKPEKVKLGESAPSPVDGFVFVKAHHNPKQKAVADDGAEPNSEVFFAASTDGGRKFSKNVRVASDVCPCCKTATLAADGKLFLGWRQVLPGNFRHIAVASSGNGGQTFSPSAIVSDDRWMLSACPVSGPALAAESGGLKVFWYTAGSAGEAGLFEAISSDGGRSFAPRKLVSSEARSGTPALVRNANGTSLVFAEKGEKVSIVPASAGSDTSQKELADAELFAATAGDQGVVIAFVKTEGNSRTVWLTR